MNLLRNICLLIKSWQLLSIVHLQTCDAQKKSVDIAFFCSHQGILQTFFSVTPDHAILIFLVLNVSYHSHFVIPQGILHAVPLLTPSFLFHFPSC